MLDERFGEPQLHRWTPVRATGGLRVNLSSVKGGLINFPLFLLEGIVILLMTPKADCALLLCDHLKKFANFLYNLNKFFL